MRRQLSSAHNAQLPPDGAERVDVTFVMSGSLALRLGVARARLEG